MNQSVIEWCIYIGQFLASVHWRCVRYSVVSWKVTYPLKNACSNPHITAFNLAIYAVLPLLLPVTLPSVCCVFPTM